MISKNFFKGLLTAGAMTVLSVGSASAAGTAADTTVANTFSLTYSVDGTEQPEINTGDVPGGSNTPTVFTVDRKIDLTVATNGNETVAPGEQDAELTFTLTNTGNDTQAYDLSLVNEAVTGPTADDFDALNLTITYYVGNSATGAVQNYTPGTPTVDVPADGELFIVVSGDIPTAGTVEDNDRADITLVADTVEPSTAGATAGDEVLADTDGINDVTGDAENVLADGSSTGREVANAGDDSATGTYIVASADLTAEKTVGIISENGTGCAATPSFPTNHTFPQNNEHAIPGACVEYRITVQNTGDDVSANASDLELVDVLPDGLTFVTAFQNGFTGGSFNTPAAGNCDGGACTVELTSPGAATPASLAFATTGTIVIRATIN